MNQPTLSEIEMYINTASNINAIEIMTYLQHNEISYRRAKQCMMLQLQYPEIWKTTYLHCLQEINEMNNLSMNNLIHYIKNGYHPEILTKSLLSNETILKDYGKCIEHSGSAWAFLSSALYKVSSRTSKEEE
jgi:hypothetical protein